MSRYHFKGRFLVTVLLTLALTILTACSKKEEDSSAAPTTPKAAAVQIDQAFVAATPAIKEQVNTAAQALRTADYESAIENLAKVRRSENVTMEQGMAIQRAMATIEVQLMQAAEAGDEKAKRAYELLRQRNRN